MNCHLKENYIVENFSAANASSNTKNMGLCGGQGLDNENPSRGRKFAWVTLALSGTQIR